MAAATGFSEAESLVGLLGIIPSYLHTFAAPATATPSTTAQSLMSEGMLYASESTVTMDSHNANPDGSGDSDSVYDDQADKQDSDDQDTIELWHLVAEEEACIWRVGEFTDKEESKMETLMCASLSLKMDDMCQM